MTKPRTSTIFAALLSLVVVLVIASIPTLVRADAQDDAKAASNVDPFLRFEALRTGHVNRRTERAKIPGGWLVTVGRFGEPDRVSIAFVPDPTHQWDGTNMSE